MAPKSIRFINFLFSFCITSITITITKYFIPHNCVSIKLQNKLQIQNSKTSPMGGRSTACPLRLEPEVSSVTHSPSFSPG